MRAVICRELTGVGGLALRGRTGRSRRPGPGEVVVEVKAAALNFPDLLMIQGLYQERPPLPFVVGTEMAGVVVRGGRGRDARCRRATAWSRRAAARWPSESPSRQRCVIPAPRALGFESAAGICITYFTTMHALKQRAQLQPGETLLVLGAAGGVGTTAVELGKQMGATVIAAASSDAKLELARTPRRGPRGQLRDARTCASASRKSPAARAWTWSTTRSAARCAEPALRSMAWNGPLPRDRLRRRRHSAHSAQPAAAQGLLDRRRVLGQLRAARARCAAPERRGAVGRCSRPGASCRSSARRTRWRITPRRSSRWRAAGRSGKVVVLP